MTSSKSGRLIPGDTLASELVAWEAPEVRDPTEITREELEAELVALREKARNQGYAEGHAAGLAAASAEVDAMKAALTTTLNALARPMEQLDHCVEEEMLALIRAITQQLVRRELRLDPGEVVGVIRAGLNALPVASQDVVVRLHPEDARLVQELLNTGDDELPWRIQADPVLERGGCQITSASSQVDGRLETRLGRVIAELLEDERDQVRSTDD
ncbi:MAG TPA: flagellar assembly protein FliH [Chromatiales bacterium]|nr:flagellar assembly protein FliH [Chromatiales bacterium]